LPDPIKHLPPGTVQFITERVIIGHEEGNNPELEPLFANHFELMQLATDIFLDVGILSPRQMVETVQKVTEGKVDGIPTIQFSVLQRIVMSPATFVALHAKINELFEQIKKGVLSASSQQAKTD
jgi:hypothetical protein